MDETLDELEALPSVNQTRIDNLKDYLSMANQRTLPTKKTKPKNRKFTGSKADLESGYAMKNGDTLWSISQATGVPIEQLMAVNDIKDPKKIKTGTVLRLTPLEDNPKDSILYVDPSKQSKPEAKAPVNTRHQISSWDGTNVDPIQKTRDRVNAAAVVAPVVAGVGVVTPPTVKAGIAGGKYLKENGPQMLEDATNATLDVLGGTVMAPFQIAARPLNRMAEGMRIADDFGHQLVNNRNIPNPVSPLFRDLLPKQQRVRDELSRIPTAQQGSTIYRNPARDMMSRPEQQNITSDQLARLYDIIGSYK